MSSDANLRVALSAAVEGTEPGLASADELCRACVALPDVDGAAISLIRAGTPRGTHSDRGDGGP